MYADCSFLVVIFGRVPCLAILIALLAFSQLGGPYDALHVDTSGDLTNQAESALIVEVSATIDDQCGTPGCIKLEGLDDQDNVLASAASQAGKGVETLSIAAPQGKGFAAFRLGDRDFVVPDGGIEIKFIVP